MTKRTLIFTALAAATLGTQALRCALLEHELRCTPPILVAAEECEKCGDHLEGTTPEGTLISYRYPADYRKALTDWYPRHHRDLELRYTIEFIPRSGKPNYKIDACVNGIPLREAARLMQSDTFPLPRS